LTPTVTFVDDLGEAKTGSTRTFCMVVKPRRLAYEVLPGRVSTGTMELDRLLLGGVPEGYALALVSPSFEQRQRMVENYVEAGCRDGQITFILTSDALRAKALAEEYPSRLVVFVCNPRTDLIVKDLPNLFRLRSVESLSEIDISLQKAFRQLDSLQTGPRRACIEIVSDILLQHHAVITRKWLMGLITTLKAKGFTTIAVVDPLILPEEVPAVSGLFDGEFRIAEREIEKGNVKMLKILRLQSQRYLKDEVTLA